MQYAERDIIGQGDYYTRHVSAMTGEQLHSKSAIAAELAHRDIKIDRLRTILVDLDSAFSFQPSCQAGVITLARCCCLACVKARVHELLTPNG